MGWNNLSAMLIADGPDMRIIVRAPPEGVATAHIVSLKKDIMVSVSGIVSLRCGF